jgi:predicted deacylase
MPIETIAGIRADPGTKAFGFMSIAPMLHGADLQVGVHVIAGQSPGPLVAVFAAQHGDELAPHLGLRRFITELDPRQLRGTVVVVPVANPIAFVTGHRDSWIDGLQADSGNLNRLWPGDPGGWICGRLAAALAREIVDRADCVIDIHAAGRNAIYYGYMRDGDDEFSRRQRTLALAFGLEIMLTHAIPYTGTLTGFCHARGQLAVGVELGEFYGLGPDRGRWPETELRRNPTEVCSTGLTNVLKQLEMLPGDVWEVSSMGV